MILLIDVLLLCFVARTGPPKGSLAPCLTHLIHAHIHGILGLCVNLKLDFRRGELQGARISTSSPPLLCKGIHAAQPLAEVIGQSGVINPGLRLCISEGRTRPVENPLAIQRLINSKGASCFRCNQALTGGQQHFLYCPSRQFADA